MTYFYRSLILVILVVAVLLSSCSGEEAADRSSAGWDALQDSTDILISVEGFAGPEAVRYDPDQDVYFVSNFNGGGNDRDANGFISKLAANGTIDSLRFMVGTDEHPLHAPRGMYITADTLWAADVDGVHGFHRETGEQIRFIDFRNLEPGFLNDIAASENSNLYVTDTGTSKVYKVVNGEISTVLDSLMAPPNGITPVPEGQSFLLAPWGGATGFPQFKDGEGVTGEFTAAESGGNFDGIEFVNGRLIAASQNDSSLHVLYEGSDQILIKVPGRPADIGIDTRRNRVAVPYITLNRVDIWELPD